MQAALAIGLAVVLVACTVLIHHEVLRAIRLFLAKAPIRPRNRILVVIGPLFAAHVAQISIYAAAYYLMQANGLGTIAGEFSGDVIDFFYFSITSFTTLGVGDLFPHGVLRIVAGVEALNGFVLIGWSASFTYLVMQQVWDDER